MEFAETIRSAWQAEHKRPAVERWIKNLMSLIVPAIHKIGKTRKTRMLIVEERISLGPKKSLMLISCRGQSFLVASGAEEICTVLQLRGSLRSTTSRSGKLHAAHARSRQS